MYLYWDFLHLCFSVAYFQFSCTVKEHVFAFYDFVVGNSRDTVWLV